MNQCLDTRATMARFTRSDGVAMAPVRLVFAAGPEIVVSVPENWTRFEAINHEGVAFIKTQRVTVEGEHVFVEF